jgi:hypothetical protein
LLNQFHLSCPRASAVGRRSEAFANPDKMDMNEFKVRPNFQAGIGRLLKCSSTVKIIAMQIALKVQLIISNSHHSTNQRVTKPLAFWALDKSQSNLDGSWLPCRDESFIEGENATDEFTQSFLFPSESMLSGQLGRVVFETFDISERTLEGGGL